MSPSVDSAAMSLYSSFDEKNKTAFLSTDTVYRTLIKQNSSGCDIETPAKLERFEAFKLTPGNDERGYADIHGYWIPGTKIWKFLQERERAKLNGQPLNAIVTLPPKTEEMLGSTEIMLDMKQIAPFHKGDKALWELEKAENKEYVNRMHVRPYEMWMAEDKLVEHSAVRNSPPPTDMHSVVICTRIQNGVLKKKIEVMKPPVLQLQAEKDEILMEEALRNTEKLLSEVAAVFGIARPTDHDWQIRAGNILRTYSDLVFCKDEDQFLANHTAFANLDDEQLGFVFYSFKNTPVKTVAGYEFDRRQWFYHSIFELWYKPLGVLLSDRRFVLGKFAMYDPYSMAIITDGSDVVFPVNVID